MPRDQLSLELYHLPKLFRQADKKPRISFQSISERQETIDTIQYQTDIIL